MLFVVASIASSSIFDMRPVVQHRISGRFYAIFIADFKVFRRSSFNFQCTRNVNFLGNFYLVFAVLSRRRGTLIFCRAFESLPEALHTV